MTSMKFKKILSAFLFLLLFSFSFLYADDYKILFVNSKNIKIGDKTAVTGLTFKDTDKIKWNNDKQHMRVRNLTTHKTYLISKSQFEEGKPSTIHHLFVTKRLSTRDWGNTAEIISSPILMLDTLLVPTGKDPGRETIDFVIIDSNNKFPIEKSLDKEFYVLPRSLFNNRRSSHVNINIFARE